MFQFNARNGGSIDASYATPERHIIRIMAESHAPKIAVFLADGAALGVPKQGDRAASGYTQILAGAESRQTQKNRRRDNRDHTDYDKDFDESEAAHLKLPDQLIDRQNNGESDEADEAADDEKQ